MRGLVLQYTLQNAVFYNGHADLGAVLGKILANKPELRPKIGIVKKEAEAVVKEVNSMSPEKQKSMLKRISPKLLVKQEKKQEELPPLKGASEGKFITRFAPSPTGPLNIGQLLRAALLPYLYAKKYKGQFILRIEDTDPRKIKKEFYGFIMEDLLSVGVKWDKLVKESDNMGLYYKNAELLLKSGKAYVCSCSAQKFRQLKLLKTECGCRGKHTKENMLDWKKMLSGSYKEGEVVARLKTTMRDPNPTMRDPPLLRIIDAKHPLRGNEYKVWPLYNFANVVEDHNSGITHVFRGKEHEHNTAIQSKIYGTLGLKPPTVINFGMVHLPGTKIHTRDMIEWVKEGKVSGWDDPALPTVRALLRRGFQPEALRKFATVCSMSKTDIQVGWENLEGINRKIIDSLANRYMVVTNPVKISVKSASNAPKITEAGEDLHPDFPARGKKKMPVDLGKVFISEDDWKRLKGRTIRLKGLVNIKLEKASEYKGKEIVTSMPKIQWVSEPNVTVEILAPKGKQSGLGEINLKKLKTGTLIQMERVGFGRIDSVKGNKVVIAFSHK